VPHPGLGVLDRVEDARGVAKKRLAGGGQVDPPRGAVEQGRADLRLELTDRLRQRGLRHVQALRRLPEVPGMRNRHEVPELTGLHVVPILRRGRLDEASR